MPVAQLTGEVTETSAALPAVIDHSSVCRTTVLLLCRRHLSGACDAHGKIAPVTPPTPLCPQRVRFSYTQKRSHQLERVSVITCFV